MSTPDRGVIYPSLSRKEINYDRRAIMNKIQKHRRRSLGSSSGDIEIPNAAPSSSNANQQNIHADRGEGFESLQRALLESTAASRNGHQHTHYDNAPTKRRDSEDTMNGYSQSPRSTVEIPTKDPFHKGAQSIIYICVVFVLLFTYGFFIESAKLVSYGNILHKNATSPTP